jgi:hypothetical protein
MCVCSTLAILHRCRELCLRLTYLTANCIAGIRARFQSSTFFEQMQKVYRPFLNNFTGSVLLTTVLMLAISCLAVPGAQR